MDNFPYDERRNLKTEAAMADGYSRQRRIQDAHQIIESLSETRREPPVEVQQAHHIGTLEAELRNANVQLVEGKRLYDGLTEQNRILAEELKRAERNVTAWSTRALDAERLYDNLKARKKTAVKKK